MLEHSIKAVCQNPYIATNMTRTIEGKQESDFNHYKAHEKEFHRFLDDKNGQRGNTEKHDDAAAKSKKHRHPRRGPDGHYRLSPIQELHMETQVLRLAVLAFMESSSFECPIHIKDEIVRDVNDHVARKLKFDAENPEDPDEVALIAENNRSALALQVHRDAKKAKDDELRVGGATAGAASGLGVGSAVMHCNSDSDDE